MISKLVQKGNKIEIYDENGRISGIRYTEGKVVGRTAQAFAIQEDDRILLCDAKGHLIYTKLV